MTATNLLYAMPYYILDYPLLIWLNYWWVYIYCLFIADSSPPLFWVWDYLYYNEPKLPSPFMGSGLSMLYLYLFYYIIFGINNAPIYISMLQGECCYAAFVHPTLAWEALHAWTYDPSPPPHPLWFISAKPSIPS